MTDYEFPVTGPVQVDATIRANDLHLTAAAVTEARVRLEPRKDDTAHRQLIEGTRVEYTNGVLIIDVPQTSAFGIFRHTPHMQITVTVPTGSQLEASTNSGDVVTSGALSDAVLRTGSGDGTFDELKSLRVASGSGDITVRDLGEGDVKSGSGDVALGTVRGNLTFKSGSGDLRVDALGNLIATPASGDVQIGQFAGVAKIRTASGDVRIAAAQRGDLAVTSASGDIQVAVTTGTAVLLDCSSASGRMHTDLQSSAAPEPQEDALELRARSASGDITVTRSC